MRGCLRVLAVLTAILFFISATVALLVVPLARAVTDRETIKESLAELDQVMVEAVPPLVARTLEQRAQQLGIPGVDLDEALLQESLQTLLPPGWMEAQTATAVDAVYDAIESGSVDDVTVQLDMQPVLERLQGDPGRQLVANVIAGIPDCPEGTLPDLNNDRLPSCIPPTLPRDVVAQQAHDQLMQQLAQNPQFLAQAGRVQIPLGQLTADANNPQAQQARENLQRLQRWFTLARNWSWLLWLIPLGSLLLIGLLVVRSVREWGMWWGWPLVATAVFVFLLTLVLPGVTTFVLRTLPPIAGTAVLPTGELARTLLDSVLDVWLNHVYLQAGLMLGIGVILVAIGAMAGQQRSSN